MKSARQRFGPPHAVDHRPLGLQAQRAPAQRHLGARLVGVDLDVVVVHRVGRHSAITPLACSQRPSMARCSMRLPSLNTRCASWPTTSSRRMSGKRPARSQVWKNGRPVDAGGQFGQVLVAEHAPAGERGAGGT
jgi:hypothetical protein